MYIIFGFYVFVWCVYMVSIVFRIVVFNLPSQMRWLCQVRTVEAKRGRSGCSAQPRRGSMGIVRVTSQMLHDARTGWWFGT